LPDAHAAEYQVNEDSAKTSASEVAGTLYDVVDISEPRRGPVARRLSRIDWLPPFAQDMQPYANLRTYDFSSEDFGGRKSDAWALGGEFGIRSGKFWRWFSVDTAFFTSQKLRGRQSRGGTKLLGSGQDDINVFGKAKVEFVKDELFAIAYRQELNLPYINKLDSRMIPNTFEAYVFGRRNDTYVLAAGHITKMKERDSEDFISMSKIAGAEGSHGVTTSGARYSFGKGRDVGVAVINSWDLFRSTYAEANFLGNMTDNTEFKLSLQATDQRSIGDEEVGSFETWAWGVQGLMSYRNGMLSAGFTDTGTDAGIFSPYGGRPSFNSQMIHDFDRAGERAWRVVFSYEFSRLGMPGLGLTMSHTQGSDAIDLQTGTGLPDRREFDATLEFKAETGRFKGLWLRLRFARAEDSEGNDEATQLRVIVNYELPII
jgi:hypothetical protein